MHIQSCTHTDVEERERNKIKVWILKRAPLQKTINKVCFACLSNVHTILGLWTTRIHAKQKWLNKYNAVHLDSLLYPMCINSKTVFRYKKKKMIYMYIHINYSVAFTMLAPNKKRKIEPRNRERLPERLIILLHNIFFLFLSFFFHSMCYFPWFALLFVRSLSVSHTFSVCVSPRCVPLYCPFSFFVYLVRFCSVCVFYSTLLQHYNKYTAFFFVAFLSMLYILWVFSVLFGC